MNLRRVNRICGVALGGAVASAALLLVALDSTHATGRNATCLGKPATVLGTGGADAIQGTNRDDVILARRGNDKVYARKGDDLICGAAGNDLLCGGKKPSSPGGSGPPDRCLLFERYAAGRKQVSGGSGDDRLIIDGGTMRGGHDDDRLEGGRDMNRFFGGPGSDFLYSLARDGRTSGFGGDGPDQIWFHTSNDLIRGGDGDDRLRGGGASDGVRGGDGDDTLRSGVGSDRVGGGDGDDRLMGNPSDDDLYGNAGDDQLDGGGGSDRCFGGRGADERKKCE